MPRNPQRTRRWFSAAACIAIPAVIALLPMQAALADNSPTSLLSSTQNTLTKTSGLGLSRFALPRTTSRTSSTSRPQAASDCTGNLICTDGITITADPTNGPAVGICDLFIGGSAVSSPSGGCNNGTTKATGNIAAAVGRTNVNLANGNDIVEADTCGIALALDLANPATATVICGTAPGLGSADVNQANILALLGPTFVSLDNNGNLAGDICGAAAALGMTDTKTNGKVYCETLSSAGNWSASIPASTVSVGNDLLSATVQKSFVTVSLTNPTLAVTICNVDAQLLGTELPLMPTGKINVDLFSNGPAVNCAQDANLNPIVSSGMINAAVGDTGGAGGLNEGGGSVGTCGANGGGSSTTGTSSNSCGTNTPPAGFQTVPGPSNGANAAGNVAVVLGQNNANAGPGSGPGGNNDLGLTANSCGGSGSGDPSAASAGVKCQNVSYVAVKGITKPPASKPPAAKPPAAAAAPALAKTGFPIASGLLGLILIVIGGIETLRRRREEASA
ncbi:MAG TPA: hypothetical protein VF137_01135 [Candidatus Dormibacteraeota bacterium]